jgi:F-type H+-transporting ATPase subunit b
VSINLTLIVQMVVFALLIWFTMRFVWPMILGALDERAKRIADGLAAAEQGQKSLAQSQARADDAIREARSKAVQIVDQAQHRANELIDQAKVAAVTEGERLLAAAQQQIQLESQRARENLRKEVAALAVAGASQLLEREIDAKTHKDLLERLAGQI